MFALAGVASPHASAQRSPRLHLLQAQLHLDVPPLLLDVPRLTDDSIARPASEHDACAAADALEHRGRRIRRAGRGTAVLSGIFAAVGVGIMLSGHTNPDAPDAIPAAVYGGIVAAAATAPLVLVGSPLLGVGNARIRQAARLRRSGC